MNDMRHSEKQFLFIFIGILLVQISGVSIVFYATQLSFLMKIISGFGIFPLVALCLYVLILKKKSSKPSGTSGVNGNKETAQESKQYNDFEKVSRQMKRRIYDLHNLFEISTNLTSILDAERLINSYLLALIGQLGTANAFLLFPDNDCKGIKSVYAKGMSDENIEQLKLPFNRSLFKFFEHSHLPVSLDDERLAISINGNYQALRELGIKWFAPLIKNNRVEGIVALGQKWNNKKYEAYDIEMLSMMTNFASVAILNAQLYQEMEKISITDDLTGLYNFRYFRKQLTREFNRADRFDHSLSLIIIDIDHFKNYNDSLGHPAGNVALRQISDLIKNAVRRIDIVSRYGGEEFCVILPEVDMGGTKIFGERIRNIVATNPFPGDRMQPGGKVTISLGAASFPKHADMENELIKRADSALYRAKHQGRNRLCVYSM